MHTARRLTDTGRLNLSGDVLPAEPGRELVPYTEPARRSWPIIRIDLPTADDDPAPAMTWEKRTAQRTPTTDTDVAVPMLQAVFTALAAGIMAGCLAFVFGWPVRVVALVFGVALASSWLWRLRLADSLLWATESITGRDVNRDGAIGRPAQSFTLANPAQARSDAAQHVATAEHEAARAELLAFVHRCYTVGTSEGAHGVKASGPDRAAYVRQRDVLMSLGVATWRNPERPRAGWKMAVSYARAAELIARHVL